jgi:hypothetical protein
MDTDNLLADLPRWFEVTLGVATAVIAVALFSLDAYFSWLAFVRHSAPAFVLVFLTSITLIGVFFLSISRRLLLDKKRNDRGLFPPLALRLAGVVFLSSPLPRMLEDSVHPRLQSDACRRPLNFNIRSHGDASRFDFHAYTIVTNALSDRLDSIHPLSTHTRQA